MEQPTVRDWVAAGCPRMYEGPNGLMDYSCFAHDYIGFCGCGQPEEAIDFLLKLLKNLDYPLYCSGDEFDRRLQERNEIMGCGEYGKDNPGLWNLIFYWLDDKGWTEHGSSIPGWLEEEGRFAIKVLEGMKKCLFTDED